jgi:hypothetical protein
VGQPLRVGLVGCGSISGQYLATIAKLPQLELIAVGDRDTARADRFAADQGVQALSVSALLADPSVDAVLNLTIPSAPCRGGTGRHRRGQDRLRREAARRHYRGGPSDRRGRHGGGRTDRMCAGHRARHRHPNRPTRRGRRTDRYAGGCSATMDR